MSEIENRLIREDDRWFYYERYRDGKKIPNTSFMKLKEPIWFLEPTTYVLEKHCGVSLDSDTIERFENLFERDIVAGYYYMGAVCRGSYGEEASKWIFGPIITEMNKTGRSISVVCPASVLREFVTALMEGRFPKHHARAVFDILLEKCPIYVDIPGLLQEIIDDPRFTPVDNSLVDVAVQTVLVANPEKLLEAKTNPKLVQWFVGQILKTNKGMSPALVKEVLERNINA